MIPRDPPYPELKASHTAAHTGTPWRDRKPPASAPVWNVIQGYGNYWMLVAAIELGVFDALAAPPPDGERHLADDLAQQLGASALHLRFVLDGLVAVGLIEQVRDGYTLGEVGERYLASDGPATMAALVKVAPGPLVNWEAFADTVRNGVPSRPIELDPGAFYRPLVEATFPTMLRAATRLDLKIGYGRRVAPRVLDLGAGAAPWSIAILTACAGATAVVNDLPDVLPVAERTIARYELSDRVELRPGDFHDVPIEDHAYDIVVLGHVLRAEGPERAEHLVRRAVAALRPEGTLIVADYFCDDTRKATPFSVLMGVTMLAATERGHTFTYSQVSGWLRDAGLEAIRLVEPIGFQQAFVAAAPRLG